MQDVLTPARSQRLNHAEVLERAEALVPVLANALARQNCSDAFPTRRCMTCGRPDCCGSPIRSDSAATGSTMTPSSR